MRIVFAGDVHGDVEQLEYVFSHAAWADADLIWVCGDFGYWPHYPFGKEFLGRASELADLLGIRLYFVDGNHENHDLLDEFLDGWAGGPIEVSPQVFWTPRGMTVEFDGVTFMSYGGAWSVDWEYRTPHVTWWEQEVISPAHVNSLPLDVKVDVLVSHEAPLAEDRSVLSYKDGHYQSVKQRELITAVAERVSADFVFCGHHHTRTVFMGATSRTPVVNVLSRDGEGLDSFAVVDTAELKRNMALLDPVS